MDSTLGRIRINSGVRKDGGSLPTCLVCNQKIKKGMLGVFIKPFGEIGRQFHMECAIKFVNEILEHTKI